jgi:BSD domain
MLGTCLQARHAMLVCLAVKEMNELRFVLVPKFLSDEQFWAIYFALTRGRLPPEAFDTSLQQHEDSPPSEQPKVSS